MLRVCSNDRLAVTATVAHHGIIGTPSLVDLAGEKVAGPIYVVVDEVRWHQGFVRDRETGSPSPAM